MLPALDWARLAIVWLDYTSTLTTEVIGDLETLSRLLIPGSVLAVTLNAHPSRAIGERRSALEKAITPERVPVGVTDSRLGEWGLAAVQHQVVSATLRASFAARTDAATFAQLLNINYQDRARMQMIAGVVGAPAFDRALEQCRFRDLPHVRGRDDEPLRLRVPLLTRRERSWLDQRLPSPEGAPLPTLPGVLPSDDVQAYAQVYRYLEATG